MFDSKSMGSWVKPTSFRLRFSKKKSILNIDSLSKFMNNNGSQWLISICYPYAPCMEYLYQHLAHFYGPQVGKYTMEHMGYPLVNVYKKLWKKYHAINR
jgi:hypothetical protein